MFGLASPAAFAASGTPAGPQGSGYTQRFAQSPLPRCVLYSSVRLSESMMRCSYQCGDRIIIRGGHNSCPSNVARPTSQ